MNLHFREEGSGPPLIILHGLFGSHRNWHPVSAVLAERFRVFSVDLRNHGFSPHHEDVTFPAMAEDLRSFLEQHQLPSARLLGHSLGGKVAMQFALAHAGLVERLVVVDIAPKHYAATHDDIFDGLLALNLGSVKARRQADAALASRIPDAAVRRFLLMNLRNGPDGTLHWGIHLEALQQNRAELTEPIHGTEPCRKPALFVRGEKSDYILDADLPHIRELFPRAELQTIPGAGHWVHAENPRAFLEGVQRFLERL